MFRLLISKHNYIHEWIKCRPKAGNSCYYSVQTLFVLTCLENLEIKIYKQYYCHLCYRLCNMVSYTKKGMQVRVFENRILRRIFEPKQDENGECGRLYNEEFHSLYLSLNIIRVFKSRRMRWAGHVARTEEGRSTFHL